MKGLLIFAAGLAVGAVTGALVVKNKVLADAKAEVEEVRAYYRSKQQERGVKEAEETKEEIKETEETKEEVKEAEEAKEETVKFDRNTYINYNKMAREYQTSKDSTFADDPYIIDPEEFGENPEYDTMTLTYFADGVLVDDVDDLVDEPDVVVGLENLKVLGDYGATSVYVRNDIYRTDYEVIKDDWNYSDIKEPVQTLPIKEKKPHQL